MLNKGIVKKIDGNKIVVKLYKELELVHTAVDVVEKVNMEKILSLRQYES